MKLAIKVDVDTDQGTANGVLPLGKLFKEYQIPATFLFSFGPDNTGKAICRIFRPGFFKKVARTKVTQVYGWKTLLSGTLLPAPHIAKRHAKIMRQMRDDGFEVGIHCYDHFRWQDYVHQMTPAEVDQEFQKAITEFQKIFGEKPQTAGAPGWQANTNSLTTYDRANLLYASDTRGHSPFFPRINNIVFKTPQIPTTLPTLDELLGLPEFLDESAIPNHYLSIMKNTLNVLTIHAELEGSAKFKLFNAFIEKALASGMEFVSLKEYASSLLKDPHSIPICELIQSSIPNRSGLLACQGL
ncbi:MAG: polysaccharide deacetylase [Verrucomicrobia bacterium GWC2_42_7]|nr:MAG: polysaccharide deacetylase [Verrucomicrobia bacterium GWC2_42_7]